MKHATDISGFVTFTGKERRNEQWRCARRARRLDSRRSFAALCCAAAASVALPAYGSGVTYTFAGVNGANWNVAGNWAPAGGPPGLGDTALFTTSSPSAFTINFNSIYSGTGLTSLFIDPFGSGDLILSQTLSTSVMIASSELLGNVSDGPASAIYSQSAGTNTAGTLTLGQSSGGSGIYNLSGGVNNVAGTLFLGSGAGAFGAYNLSNSASLTVSGSEYVGYNGTGVFNQTGGSHAVALGLILAFNPNSGGTYTLSGGNLIASSLVVGDDNNAVGIFNHSAGNATITGSLSIASFSTNSAGTYNLSNSASLTVAGLETVGDAGAGVFNQTGGIHSAGGLVLGDSLGSSGTFNLSGGLMTVLGSVYVGGSFSGSGGVGVMLVSGGSLNAGFNTIKVFDTSNGASLSGITLNGGTLTAAAMVLPDWSRLTLNGGALNLGAGLSSNPGSLIVGKTAGPATLNQLTAGGTVNVATNLYLGYSPGVTGTYNLGNAASLTVSGAEYVGFDGTGIFNQTGGVHTISTRLTLAYNPFSNGAYTLSGGVLNASRVLIGDDFSAVGIFNHSAGTATIGLDLTLADFATGSAGTYNLSNSASLTVGGNEFVGLIGSGVFNQTGGSHTAGAALFLGYSAGSFGTYNLSGGLMTVLGNVYVGGSSSGTGGVGILSVSGGSFNAGANTIKVYNTSNGTTLSAITLTGGTVTAAALVLPDWSRLTFNGGVLNLGAGLSSNTGSLIVGNTGGPATLNQLTAGGTVNVPSLLYIGYTPSGTGAYNLSNGASLSVGSIEYVGYNGTGTFNQSGGSHAVAVSLRLAFNPNSRGTYSLSGGTLNALNLTVGDDNNAVGIFNHSAGSATIGADLLVADFSMGSAGTYNLSGAASLTVGGNERVGVVGTGLFNQTGGTHTVNGLLTVAFNPFAHASFNLSGGALAAVGGLVNNDHFTFSAGTLTGNVTNNAGALFTLTGAGTRTVTGAVVNNGSMKATSTTVTFTGAYSGSGAYNSDPSTNLFQSDVNILPGGIIAGSFGDQFTINGTYTNAGTYLNSGGALSAQNVVNNGAFTQSAGLATLANLTGTGNAAIGGAGLSLVTVASFAQGSITINGSSTLRVATNVVPVTNSAANLQINGSGQLDLANHALVVSNTLTPASTIRNYLINGYNAGAWNGTGGITSTTAAADHVALNNKLAVGYSDNRGPGSNQVLVVQTVYGDATLNGVVDLADFGRLSANFGATAGASWDQGDFTYDGLVDLADFGKLSANFGTTIPVGGGGFGGAGGGGGASAASQSSTSGANKAAVSLASAAVTLTGKATSSAAPASGPGVGQAELDVDTNTGNMKLIFNQVTTRGYEIKSSLSRMNADPNNLFDLTDSLQSFSATNNASQTSSKRFGELARADNDLAENMPSGYRTVLNGTFDLGALEHSAGSGEPFRTGGPVNNLVFTFLDAAGNIQNGSVVYLPVPEPTSLALLGLGAAGLLGRRRRRTWTQVAPARGSSS